MEVGTPEVDRFTGLTFHVRPYSPGTSKWNNIEHGMFSFIKMNWKEQPLSSYEIIVNFIGSTTNKSKMRFKCVLDTWEYKPGITVSDKNFATINIKETNGTVIGTIPSLHTHIVFYFLSSSKMSVGYVFPLNLIDYRESIERAMREKITGCEGYFALACSKVILLEKCFRRTARRTG